MSAPSENSWAAPLGRVSSGIFILTVRSGAEETGMLTSWVQQAGFEPPMVSVAVKAGRYVADWLTAGAPFVVNVVGAGQSQFLKHFGRGFAPDEPAFAGLNIERTTDGIPWLADSLGYLECRPEAHLDSGDHRIFLAQVVNGQMLNEVEPMLHVRKSVLRY